MTRIREEEEEPFNTRIKTTEQRTIIQQYSDWYIGRWRVSCYIVYSEDGSGRAGALPSPLQMWQPTRQRPVYQLHSIWCGSIIVSGL